jgi:hypothetical protein
MESLINGNIAFFNFVITLTITSLVLSSLEASEDWSRISSSRNTSLLKKLINQTITPPTALRSLSSLKNLISNHQHTTPHSQWALQSKNHMRAFLDDFKHPTCPGAISADKILVAVLLMTSSNVPFVEYTLLKSKVDLSNLSPAQLLDDLRDSQTNLSTYKLALSSSKTDSNSDKSQSKKPQNPLPETSTIQSINAGHVLATHSSPPPKADMKLMTKSFPYSRPPGILRQDQVNDGCTHCFNNGWHFVSHSADECFDVRRYRERFGEIPTPSLPTNTPQSNLQNQSSTIHSLLNMVGSNHIQFQPSNNSFAAYESCTDFASDNKKDD